MSDTNLPDTLSDARLLDAFWALVAAQGWRGVTMQRLAEAAGTTAAVLRARFRSPFDVLLLHSRTVDQEVLAGTIPTRESGGIANTPRDRLFDVLMRRLDALTPHRAGIVRFYQDTGRDPLLFAALLPGIAASMAWMLEAAELDPRGAGGLARVQGLTGIWLLLLRSWTTDEEPGLGKTMKTLDEALDRAAQLAGYVRLTPGDLAVAAPLPV